MTDIFLHSVLPSILSALAGALVGALITFWKKSHTEERALREAVKGMLRKMLADDCDKYELRGYCSLDEKEEAQMLYDNYHALGGNGTGTAIIKKIQALPNR